MIKLIFALAALAGPLTAEEARTLTGKYSKGDKIKAAEVAIRKEAKSGNDEFYFYGYGSCSGLDALKYRGFRLNNNCSPYGTCSCRISWWEK